MITLEAVFSHIGIQYSKDLNMLKKPLRGISIDSRTVKPDEIFFAIKGKNVDGHNFVKNALDAGAALAVVRKEFTEIHDARLIYVEEPLQSLHLLANYIRTHYNPLTIAITGSVGKTTTKNFVGAFFDKIGSTVSSQKSYNNEFGIPLTLCKIHESTKYACVEVGINTPGEMDKLAETVAPNISVITNIGMAHVGRFESLDAILEEKIKLLDRMCPNGTAILNADDDLLASLQLNQNASVLWFGLSSRADIRVMSRDISNLTQKLSIATPSGVVRVEISPSDEGTMYACLACVATAVSAHIEPSVISSILNDLVVESRLRISSFPNGQIIDDTYNASAASIINGIRFLASTQQPIVLILGDLREVGDYLVDSYKQILENAKDTAALVIAVGETSASWKEAANACEFNPSQLITVEKWKDAIDAMSQITHFERFSVLIKGSRFSHLERIALALGGQNISCAKTSCDKYIHCSECSLRNS